MGLLEHAPATRSPRAATCRPASPRAACLTRPSSYPARHLPPVAEHPAGPGPPGGPTRRPGRPEKGYGHCGQAASGRPRSGTRAGRPPAPRPGGHRGPAAGRGRSRGPSRRARGSRPPGARGPWRGLSPVARGRRLRRGSRCPSRRPRTPPPPRRVPTAQSKTWTSQPSVKSPAALLQSRPRSDVSSRRRAHPSLNLGSSLGRGTWAEFAISRTVARPEPGCQPRSAGDWTAHQQPGPTPPCRPARRFA